MPPPFSFPLTFHREFSSFTGSPYPCSLSSVCSCVCTLALKYALAPNAFAPAISVSSSFFIVFGGSRQPVSHFLVFPGLSSLSLPLYVPHIAAPDPVVKNEKKGKGAPSTAMHRLEPISFPQCRTYFLPPGGPLIGRSSRRISFVLLTCAFSFTIFSRCIFFSFFVVTFRSFDARERERDQPHLFSLTPSLSPRTPVD
jgi:hypothetical protein